MTWPLGQVKHDDEAGEWKAGSSLMGKESGIAIGSSSRIPARVLACLTHNTITVILHPGAGLADRGVKIILPIEDVPPDLRMPNSEFDVIFDEEAWRCTTVVRRGDSRARSSSPG